MASLRVQPVHKDLCPQVYDLGETVPALKIQSNHFGTSGPDISSTYTESDYEQYNEYSFHFGLLFFRFLRSTRPISTSSLAMSKNVLPSFKARSGSSRHSNHDAVQPDIAGTKRMRPLWLCSGGPLLWLQDLSHSLHCIPETLVAWHLVQLSNDDLPPGRREGMFITTIIFSACPC